MRLSKTNQIVLTTGLALFAMFFGAGNMVFPLAIGADAGQHLLAAWLAFLLAGVGIPFLGLFAISLYDGDYWDFFGILGKYLSFAVVTFIIFIIGPLFAAPRTEDITFSTLQPFLPTALTNPFFSIFYFVVIFFLSYKHQHVINIIGRVISPLKLTAFIILIAASLMTMNVLLPTPKSLSYVVSNSLSTGYGTMDLLGAFFYCAVAYKSIVHKCAEIGITDRRVITITILKACVIGAILIGLIYTGFMFSAAMHARDLQNTPTPAMIVEISHVVLGKYGAFFVCICVTLACIATATALAVVSARFFFQTLFRHAIPRVICLILVLMFMYTMSILGFDFIMKVATPILNVLYPCLIVLCVVNIYRKLK